MPNDTTSSPSRAGLLNTLLAPIQKLIQLVLAKRTDRPLTGASTRNTLALSVDALLVRQFPLARLVAPDARRKLIRRQLDLVIDEILLNDALPAESVGTGFESFIVTVAPSAAAPAVTAEEAVRAVLGREWTISPLPLDDRSFAATPPAQSVSVQEAWSLAHRLKAQPGIRYAEPNIIVPLVNLPAEAAPSTAAKKLFGPKHLPASNPHEWSLGVINAKQAWKKAEAEGRPSRGENIIVGHPDTGYTRHVENWSDDPAKRRLLFEFGWDFWKNDSDPTDDLVSPLGGLLSAGMIANPGHGTGTSSVIFSGEGPASGSGPDFVSGVAPRARLIPFRVAPTVVGGIL